MLSCLSVIIRSGKGETPVLAPTILFTKVHSLERRQMKNGDSATSNPGSAVQRRGDAGYSVVYEVGARVSYDIPAHSEPSYRECSRNPPGPGRRGLCATHADSPSSTHTRGPARGIRQHR